MQFLYLESPGSDQVAQVFCEPEDVNTHNLTRLYNVQCEASQDTQILSRGTV